MGFLMPSSAPTVSSAPAAALTDEAKKAKKQRSALLSTEGMISGQELQPGQVSARGNLFGN